MSKQYHDRTKNYGLPSSKKSDSFLAKKQKAEERTKIDLDETANLYAEFIAEFKPELTEDNTQHFKPHTTDIKVHKVRWDNDQNKKRFSHDKTPEKTSIQHKRNFSKTHIMDQPSDKNFTSRRPDFLPGLDEDNSESSTLYVSNLPLNITPNDLANIFVNYGPIGNIKIVPNHKDPGKNPAFAFVSYMCNHDACTAYESLRKNTTSMNLFVSWARKANLPSCPTYLSTNYSRESYKNDQSNKIFVKFPRDWAVMKNIHRFIEFLVRNGPLFEAEIMSREVNNPKFSFLFDRTCEDNIYYRWKLFSILNGNSPYKWRLNEFKMFTNGPIFVPPSLPPGCHPEFTQKSPIDESLIGDTPDSIVETQKLHTKILNEKQRIFLFRLLRHVTVSTKDIAEIMVWSLDHVEHAKEIVDIIYDSLCIESTPIKTKIARLYVVNDILYNSSIEKSGSAEFRRQIEKYVPKIIENFQNTIKNCDRKVVAERIKNLVIPCLNAWQKWLVFSPDLLQNLSNKITGDENNEIQENIDGVPMTSNEISAIENKLYERSNISTVEEEDIDGEPITQSELESILHRKGLLNIVNDSV